MLPKNKLVIVSVSKFVKKDLQISFLKDYPIKLIYNAIDTDVFKPVDSYKEISEKYSIPNGNIILAAFATSWSERKGLSDYYKLINMLPFNFTLMLVGVDDNLQQSLPSGILGVKRTNTVSELVKLYSAASIVMNLASEESFGKTTPEGMSCGTPSIVYNCTASPELVDDKTGLIVEKGDLHGVVNAVKTILSWDKKLTQYNCRNRVLRLFDMKKNWNQYLDLYEDMINNN